MRDIGELVKRMRGLAEYVDDCEEAADALEAQARRIAELEAENTRLKKLLKPIAKAKQHIGSVVPTWIIDSKDVEKIRVALKGEKG